MDLIVLEKRILNNIKEKFGEDYVEKDNLTKVFCKNKDNVKLVILGCNPSVKRIISKEKK